MTISRTGLYAVFGFSPAPPTAACVVVRGTVQQGDT